MDFARKQFNLSVKDNKVPAYAPSQPTVSSPEPELGHAVCAHCLKERSRGDRKLVTWAGRDGVFHRACRVTITNAEKKAAKVSVHDSSNDNDTVIVVVIIIDATAPRCCSCSSLVAASSYT